MQITFTITPLTPGHDGLAEPKQVKASDRRAALAVYLRLYRGDSEWVVGDCFDSRDNADGKFFYRYEASTHVGGILYHSERFRVTSAEPNCLIVLNPFREIVEWIDSNTERATSQLTELGFVPASDGVWLPKCDLKQYEAGQRKPADLEA